MELHDIVEVISKEIAASEEGRLPKAFFRELLDIDTKKFGALLKEPAVITSLEENGITIDQRYIRFKELSKLRIPCSDCGTPVRADLYPKNPSRTYGISSRCTDCQTIINTSPEYRKVVLRYKQSHPHLYSAYRQLRRARERALPVDYSGKDEVKRLRYFAHTCSLTGSERSDDSPLHMDHFIPIGWNHGGSYLANMVPLRYDINISKGDRNPFEAIKDHPYDIRRQFHNVVVPLVADRHGLTTEDFERFVYWLEDHKRTIEEALEDDRCSLGIWAESTGFKLPDKAERLCDELCDSLKSRDKEKILEKFEEASSKLRKGKQNANS